MKYPFLLLLFSNFFAFAQTPAEINKAVGLPDSLVYKREIRVYKDRGISNNSSVFRFYEYENKKWKSEVYNYYSGGKNTKTELKSEKDLNYTWVDMLNTHILLIPDEPIISYKIEYPIEIVEHDGEYDYQITKGSIIDGTGYEIFMRSGNKQNHINYCNPESYLKIFPGVDELESVVDLINIIRNDFGIWKD